MKRNQYPLLAVAALLLAVTTAFVLWGGLAGPAVPTGSGPLRPVADMPTSPVSRPAATSEVGEGPGRRPLENPAEPSAPASAPVPTLLEGRVRESGGRGLPGVQVRLVALKAGQKQELERTFEVLEAIEEMAVRMRESRSATGGSTPELDRLLESHWSQGLLKSRAAGQTDGEGRYRFDPVTLPDGEEALYLVARPVKGYLFPEPLRLDAGHLGAGRGPDVVLLRGGRIEGFVVGLKPRQDSLEVRAWRLGEKEAQDRRQSGIDRDGAFAFGGLRPGRWRLALVRSGENPAFAWGPLLTLAEDQRSAGVRLVPTSSALLEVDVFGPGRTPLELGGMLVLGLRALGPAGEEGAECAVAEDLFSIPRKEGEPWRLEGLAPGRYRLRASLLQAFGAWRRGGEEKDGKGGKDLLTAGREIELARGPNRVELIFERLPELTELELRIRDRHGAPVGQAWISLHVHTKEVWHQPKGLRTGPDGVARVRNLLPLPYRLQILGRGFVPEQVEVDLTGEPGGTLVRRELVLNRGGAVAGRLLGRDGNGIPRARIRARGGREQDRTATYWDGDKLVWMEGQTMVETDEKGVFRLEGLAPGRWELLVEGKEGVPFPVELTEEELKELELKL